MFEIRRLMVHKVLFFDNREEHQIVKSDAIFHLTDEEFLFLQELPKEYSYHEFDNEFYIDRHPSILEEGIDNIEFIEDYKEHLDEKFFVLYEYKRVDEDV